MPITLRSRRRMVLFLLVIPALVGAGCSRNDSGFPGPAETTSPVPTPLPTITPSPVTTATTMPPAGPTTTVPAPTTSPPVRARVSLLADGLGVVAFGEPMETAMDNLSGLIGAPEEDQVFSGPWADDMSCAAATGYGCDNYLRVVDWATPRLTAVFLDGPDDPVARFSGWIYGGGLELTTPHELTAGMLFEEVREAVGDGLQVPTHPDRCTGEWEAATGDGIGLRLTGDPAEASTRVSLLFAGQAFSAC